jgi:hypothetical protein
MLAQKQINTVVSLLAGGEFVNAEAFSSEEIAQILSVWRVHPQHPNNTEEGD